MTSLTTAHPLARVVSGALALGLCSALLAPLLGARAPAAPVAPVPTGVPLQSPPVEAAGALELAPIAPAEASQPTPAPAALEDQIDPALVAMARGGPTRSGVAGSHAAVPPLARRWQVQMPDGLFAAPLVAGATVYAAAAGGTLYALDRASGGLRWSYQAGDWVLFDNITVCADRSFEEGGLKYLAGNLKLGYKGQPALVGVRNISQPSPLPGYEEAVFIDANISGVLPKEYWLVGELYMLGDLAEETVMGSSFIKKASAPDLPQNLMGAFNVDPVNGAIVYPQETEANPITGAYRAQLDRGDGFSFPFIAAASLGGFGELNAELLEAEFDLKARTFGASVPVAIEKTDTGGDDAYVSVTVDAEGTFKRTVPSFLAHLAGSKVVSAVPSEQRRR